MPIIPSSPSFGGFSSRREKESRARKTRRKQKEKRKKKGQGRGEEKEIFREGRIEKWMGYVYVSIFKEREGQGREDRGVDAWASLSLDAPGPEPTSDSRFAGQ